MVTSDNPDKVLSTHEAAKKCYVSARTIRNWIQENGLKAYQTVGGQYKIKVSDLEDFVRKNNMLMDTLDEESERKRVLIVDDDPEILEFISLNLKNVGFEVETAENGIEVGTKVMDFKPDIILLDMKMPEMDGFETIEYLKNFEPTKDIPVIAVTGLKEKEEVERIYKAGADSYLPKPIKLKELLEEICKRLNISIPVIENMES